MPLFLLTLLALGLLGGFFSGLLGIGGGIIMVPLLIFVPPLLGLHMIDIKTAAGITMVQSLAGSLSGLVAHHRNKYIHRDLALSMGVPAVIGSLIGSVLSKHFSGYMFYALFASLALLAAIMMLLPKREVNDDISTEDIAFNKPLAYLLAFIIGLAGGIIGQGGAFIVIPVMLYILKIPTKLALGSSVVISFMTALAGFIGKWGTGQIPLLMAAAVAFGAVIGAQFGGLAAKRLQTKVLRGILATLIAGTALKMWYGLSIILFVGVASVLLIWIGFVIHNRALQRMKNEETSRQSSA
ncbi:MAG: sulfite exporter TauE/SafE family protein [Desulfitobacterium hafniense]|nr:sulfite exporter TauE/SafE family protein [Desulfitobacterium hafniense]